MTQHLTERQIERQIIQVELRTRRPNTAWATGDGSVAILLTTPGFVAFVDEHDYPTVEAIRWNLRRNSRSKTTYAYGYSRTLKTNVFMHKMVMQDPFGQNVDHVDGNGLNNRRKNLRLASGSENCANRDPHSPSKHGFRGICAARRKGVWVAKVKFHGRSIHIGTFSTKEAAALAYDSKVRELWGEFAKTNFS